MMAAGVLTALKPSSHEHQGKAAMFAICALDRPIEPVFPAAADWEAWSASVVTQMVSS